MFATADLTVVPPIMAHHQRMLAWREWSGGKQPSPTEYSALCDTRGLRPEDVRQIDVDVPRTSCPGADGDVAQDAVAALRRILVAYSVRAGRPAAYTQGMNFVAAFLLRVTGVRNERLAFGIMCGVFDNILQGYYDDGLCGFKQDCAATLLLAQRLCPTLAQYSRQCGLPLEVFLPRWMMCAFTTVLCHERCERVWDALLCTAHCRGAPRRVLVNTAVVLLASQEEAVACLPPHAPEQFNDLLQHPGRRVHDFEVMLSLITQERMCVPALREIYAAAEPAISSPPRRPDSARSTANTPRSSPTKRRRPGAVGAVTASGSGDGGAAGEDDGTQLGGDSGGDEAYVSARVRVSPKKRLRVAGASNRPGSGSQPGSGNRLRSLASHQSPRGTTADAAGGAGAVPALPARTTPATTAAALLTAAQSPTPTMSPAGRSASRWGSISTLFSPIRASAAPAPAPLLDAWNAAGAGGADSRDGAGSSPLARSATTSGRQLRPRVIRRDAAFWSPRTRHNHDRRRLRELADAPRQSDPPSAAATRGAPVSTTTPGTPVRRVPPPSAIKTLRHAATIRAALGSTESPGVGVRSSMTEARAAEAGSLRVAQVLGTDTSGVCGEGAFAAAAAAAGTSVTPQSTRSASSRVAASAEGGLTPAGALATAAGTTTSTPSANRRTSHFSAAVELGAENTTAITTPRSKASQGTPRTTLSGGIDSSPGHSPASQPGMSFPLTELKPRRKAADVRAMAPHAVELM